jgi:tetratricopeptide (TPR) repeat protein
LATGSKRESVQQAEPLLARKAGDGSALRDDPTIKSMKLNILIPVLLASAGGQAAAQQSEFATGRAHYTEGEFRKAAAHFQLALKTNPNDAVSYYWMGMSYQGLADIATPFGGKYNSMARVYLTKAMELAPSRPDYRRELFDLLVDSADSSRTALKQAADLLQTISECDPDYNYMRRRFAHESRVNSSPDARLGRLFLIGPRAVYRIAELPASALASRRTAEPRTPTQ